MITRLYLDKFYTHQDKTFLFQKGLTGVIGPNESGKSLITEGIRYALFGSAALRATAPKDLHVELDFVVNGIDYTVVRKGTKVTLGDIATGTKPVNEAIVRILGYDLQVFDVANSCNQGQVEALSDMRPAERKAMVDRTVGLDTLDVVIKHLGERGNSLKSQAMGMRAALVEPVRPAQPEGYTPSETLKPQLATADALCRERNQILGFLQHSVAEPTAPRGRTKDELRPLRAAAADRVAEIAELTRYLDSVPEAPVEPEYPGVDRAVIEHERLRLIHEENRKRLQTKLNALEMPEYTETELQWLISQHDAADLWAERQRLLAQGHLCCPSCNHSWPVAGNVPEAVETGRPAVSRSQIERQRTLLGNVQEKTDLEWALSEMGEVVDRSADLKLLLEYEALFPVYERMKASYDKIMGDLPTKAARYQELLAQPDLREALDAEWSAFDKWAAFDSFEAEAVSKRLRLQDLKEADENQRELNSALTISLAYEQDLSRFERDQARYEEQVALWQETVDKSAVYLDTRLAVHALKTKVKSYLLPSLNKVASILINQMTGGARYQVEVNDDFEITVDGSPINTLSGSGKAVANLAIRIGLGQILTNRVFSLFMADEVDGSMDADRADYVAKALQRLTGMVSQVILITHKRPETDHTIELRK